MSRYIAVTIMCVMVSICVGAESASAIDDGVWSALTPPTSRNRHSAVYDAVRDRMVVFGGREFGVTRRDLWALSLSGPPEWTPLTPTNAPIARRCSESVIYDPIRDRLIIFGGVDDSGSPFGDVWAVSLAGGPIWSQVFPTGIGPAARSEHSATYDPVRDRMLVFGGTSGSAGVWSLSLAGTPAWTQLSPTGTAPSARAGHSAIYDPSGDRLIIFGGHPPGSTTALGDTWSLSLAGTPTWTLVASSGPTPRYGHTAIYDGGAQRMVICAGEPSLATSNTWALSLGLTPAWTQLNGTTPPAGNRSYHSAIFDPLRDRMLVFGIPSYGVWNDVEALSLDASPTWSICKPGVFEPINPTQFYSAVEDPLRQRLVAYGGNAGSPDAQHGAFYQFTENPSLWTYLSPLAPGNQPDILTSFSIVRAPEHDAIVLYGGYDQFFGQTVGGIWTASLSSDPTAWHFVNVITPDVLKRQNHSAVWNTRLSMMVVYGGVDAADSLQSDVWAIDPFAGSPQWQQWLPPTSANPGVSINHTAIYQPRLDRMVVYGGGLGSQVYFMRFTPSFAWEVPSVTGGPPPARQSHSAVYDPTRNRMLIFGGGVLPYLNDTWSLSFAGGAPYAWSQLAPTGGAPSPRAWHTAVYDSLNEAMVVFGGFGGEYNADVSVLSFPRVLGVPVADQRGAVRPTITAWPCPSRGQIEFAATVGVGNEGRKLAVIDVSGRKVWETDLSARAGTLHVSWNGRTADGSRAAPGVYLVRVDGLAGSRGRFVVVE